MVLTNLLRQCVVQSVYLSCLPQMYRTTAMSSSSSAQSDTDGKGAVGQLHVERTAHNSRQECSSEATVLEVADLSPSVKHLLLAVNNPELSFKPGQWVDFTIRGLDVVGGFSMCSSPQQLQQQHCLQLAVKHSPHPPAHWVHAKCRAGDQVHVHVGGDFVYPPQSVSAEPHNLLLVAGGVGINPLVSILRYLGDGQQATPAVSQPEYVHLLYSAKSQQELLFKDDILSLCKPHRCRFFITGEKNSTSSSLDLALYNERRVQREDLATVQSLCPSDRPLYSYICGPPPMTDTVETWLLQLGWNQKHIFYEKWW